MPIISWSGSSSSPRRAAKAAAVAIVSVSDTSMMPTAARSSGPTSSNDVHGNDGVGKPSGKRADGRDPVAGQVEDRRHDRGARHRHEHRRDARHDARQQQQDDEHADADERPRRVWVSSRCSKNARTSSTNAVGVGREAEQLRELADDDRDRQAVHVADLHLARQQVGDEAELRDAEPDLDEPDEQRQHPRERDRLPRILGDQERHDGGEDQRRHRRVRPEHEHARRTEDRVADEAPDRRVEARDRGEPGQLGVRHALRHEDRGEHETGDEVRSHPLPPVRTDGADPRDPPIKRHGPSSIAGDDARRTVTGAVE